MWYIQHNFKTIFRSCKKSIWHCDGEWKCCFYSCQGSLFSVCVCVHTHTLLSLRAYDMPYVFLDAKDTAVNKLDVAPVLMLFIYSSVLSRVQTDHVVCRVLAVYRYQMEELGTGICWVAASCCSRLSCFIVCLGRPPCLLSLKQPALDILRTNATLGTPSQSKTKLSCCWNLCVPINAFFPRQLYSRHLGTRFHSFLRAEKFNQINFSS